MSDDNLIPDNEKPAASKMFTEAEVQRMMRERRERDAEALKEQNRENQILKNKLEELEGKMQKGTASNEEAQQLQAARQTAAQSQQRGYTDEEVKAHVSHAMQQNELAAKLKAAHDKDPEFAKLVSEHANKQDGLTEQEVAGMGYLPNAPAVIKHLMKDPKALATFRAGLSNFQNDRGVAAMQVLNNLSDRLQGSQQTPEASNFTPPETLSDASDDDQNFDMDDYINKKY